MSFLLKLDELASPPRFCAQHPEIAPIGEVLFSVWLAVQRNRVQGVLLRRRSSPHTSHTVHGRRWILSTLNHLAARTVLVVVVGKTLQTYYWIFRHLRAVCWWQVRPAPKSGFEPAASRWSRRWREAPASEELAFVPMVVVNVVENGICRRWNFTSGSLLRFEIYSQAWDT